MVVLAAAVWIGLRALIAKNDLEAARADIGALKDHALSFDAEAMNTTLDSISVRTENARALTSDPVWRAAELVPVLGANLVAVREVAAIVDDTVGEVVRPLMTVASAIDPASFAPKDGALDLALFETAAGPVSEANDGIQALVERARNVPSDGTFGQVNAARIEILGMLESYAGPLSTLDAVLPLLPPALGADGPRLYVLMFQNPAEPRALGGAALSFSLISADQGRVSLVATKPAATGEFSHYGESVIPIPDGAEVVYPYGEFGNFIVEATARPSFTTAAQIVTEMWGREFGESIDGVISIDPIALSYLLRATGPIEIGNGDVITADNLAGLLLNEVYLRYAGLSPAAAKYAHDALFAQMASAMFSHLTAGTFDAAGLVDALAQGWNEHRVLFWSAHEEEESQLALVGLNGELPLTDDSAVRAGLYFQDSVGSKLGYYLRQSVQLSHGSCTPGGDTTYRLQASMTNTIDGVAAQDMPFHITGEWERSGLYPGLNRMTMRFYAPPGATITGAFVDGIAVAIEPMHDTDYPVGKVVVTIPPGATVSLAFEFTLAGDAERPFEAQLTPLVTPTTVETTPLVCGVTP